MIQDDIFDTPKKKQEALVFFQELLNDPGWKLLIKVIDANVKFKESQLRNGLGENETKEDIDRIRGDIKCLEFVRDIPMTLIKDYETLSNAEDDFKPDPYNNMEDEENEQKRV